MSRYRLFQLLVAAALLLTAAFTAREAFATTLITARVEAVSKCQDLPSRHSVHTKEVGGMRVTYSEDGPTGVDGGLVELMTAYRTCSR